MAKSGSGPLKKGKGGPMNKTPAALNAWQRWRAVLFYQVFAVWIWLRSLGLVGDEPAWGGVTVAANFQAFVIAMAIKVKRTGRP